MFKKILISLIIIGCAMIVYYFLIPNNKKTTKQELVKVTYGWNEWPGVLPYLVAYEKGYFAKYGLDVEMVHEESYGKMLDGLNTGKIDFSGDLVLIDVMKNHIENGNLQIVGVTDFSDGADAIMAKGEIDNIDKLKGKRVGVEVGTLGEYLLFSALDQANILLNEVEEVDMTAQEAAQAYIDGKIDVAVSYEPDITNAVKQAGGQVIYSSSDVPGLIVDTLVFDKEYVEKNPNVVKAVLSAYFDSVEYIKNNSKQAYSIGADYFKITPIEFEEQISGLKIIDKRDNLTAMSFSITLDSLYGSGAISNDFLQEIGKVNKHIDLSEIINPYFVKDFY